MLETTKSLAAILNPAIDKPNNLEMLEPWSESLANKMAEQEAITLTAAHWEVIESLRNHYQEYGPDASGRSLLHCLEVEFSEQGGKQYLYGLFPRGPVNQACRIAGIPLPPHSTDPSFGSSM
jgi:tRNA 2-thiouridine synthesizing protein E